MMTEHSEMIDEQIDEQIGGQKHDKTNDCKAWNLTRITSMY